MKSIKAAAMCAAICLLVASTARAGYDAPFHYEYYLVGKIDNLIHVNNGNCYLRMGQGTVRYFDSNDTESISNRSKKYHFVRKDLCDAAWRAMQLNVVIYAWMKVTEGAEYNNDVSAISYQPWRHSDFWNEPAGD